MSNLLSQASLVMIPSGYKEDVVYSQIPTSGAGDLSFTRASNGTRINSAGLVEVCPWNLVEDSENFGVNAVVYITIGPNVTTAPNGTTTADSMIEDGTNNLHAVYDFGALTYIAGVYTLSCYVKKGIRDWVRVQFYDGTNTQSVWANVNTGVLGTVVSPATATIESVGDGWYRISISTTMLSASGGWAIYSATSDGGTTYTGTNGATALYLWGLQINIGSTAKPYFPTTDRLNVPRLTYQNGGGGCPSLLLEKQSTNLVKYSQDISNTSGSSWGDGSSGGTATLTANYATSPDGTSNATRVQLNQGSGYALWQQILSVTLGASYTYSIWLKSLNGTPTIVWLYDGAANRNITLTSEWVRYTFSYTASSTNTFPRFAVWSSTWGTSSTADILAWGAQLEASSYTTSYIPTTSSSATRVADACFKTGISSLIGQTEGTFFLELSSLTNDVTNEQIALSDGTDSNTIKFVFGSVVGGVKAEGKVGGVGQFGITQSTSNYISNKKIAIGYKANDFVFYYNGVQVGVDTAGTVPTMSAFNFSTGASSFLWNGKVNEAIIFPTRLTNAELASLTTI